MKILPLFATNIFILENIIEEVDFSKKNHKCIGPEERGYEAEDLRILNFYPKLHNRLLSEWNKIAKEVLCLTNNEFFITTSWLTKTPGYQKVQEFHRHKNSFYSGIFYYEDYDPNCAPLEVVTPLDAFSDYLLIPANISVINCNNWYIQPEKYTLIFFPSYLSHRIGENLTNVIRHSLSFNIAPVGVYGIHDSTFSSEWFNESSN